MKIGYSRAIKPLLAVIVEGEISIDNEILVKFGEEIVEPLIKLLAHKKKYVREKAAEILGDIGDERAVDPLIKKLKDEDRYVKKEAIIALGKLADKRAVNPLIELTQNKDEDKNRCLSDVIEALAELGDNRAVTPLLDLLLDDGIYSSYEIVKALVKLGDPRAIGALQQFRKIDKASDYSLRPLYGANLVEVIDDAIVKLKEK